MKRGEQRLRILGMVRDDPMATITELSVRSGLSRTTVHFHLVKLDKDGMIRMNRERGNRTGQYHRHIPAEELSRIRREAAVKTRRKKKTLQERIDAVVEKALRTTGSTFKGERKFKNMKAHRIA